MKPNTESPKLDVEEIEEIASSLRNNILILALAGASVSFVAVYLIFSWFVAQAMMGWWGYFWGSIWAGCLWILITSIFAGALCDVVARVYVTLALGAKRMRDKYVIIKLVHGSSFYGKDLKRNTWYMGR